MLRLKRLGECTSDIIQDYQSCRNRYASLRYDKELQARRALKDALLSCHDSRTFFRLLTAHDPKEESQLPSLSVLHDHFEQLAQPPDPSPLYTSFYDDLRSSMAAYTEAQLQAGNPADTDSPAHKALDAPFTEGEVRDALNSVNLGKSVGRSGIPAECFRMPEPVEKVMVEGLTIVFNKILQKGEIPQEWKEALLVAIPKPGKDSTQAKHTRGITLVDSDYKIFAQLLHTRLEAFYSAQGIREENQAGFRTGYNTIDHCITLHIAIESALRRNKKLYCAFVDFSKAFDYINRDALFHKLHANGVKGRVFCVLRDIYSGLRTAMKGRSNEVYRWFASLCGVRQGCILSPALFTFFINDFESFLREKGVQGVQLRDAFVRALLYADDMALIAESANELRQQLVLLSEYCEKWNLFVSTDKTECVVFQKGRIKSDERFFYRGVELKQVTEFKYLGLIFHQNGTFTACVAHRVEKAERALGIAIRRTLAWGGGVDFFIHLWNVFVLPVLMYGAELWGVTRYDKVERFINKAARFALGISHRGAPVAGLRGELGWMSGFAHQSTRLLTNIRRMASMPESRLVRQAWSHSLDWPCDKNESWARRVVFLALEHGFQQPIDLYSSLKDFLKCPNLYYGTARTPFPLIPGRWQSLRHVIARSMEHRKANCFCGEHEKVRVCWLCRRFIQERVRIADEARWRTELETERERGEQKMSQGAFDLGRISLYSITKDRLIASPYLCIESFQKRRLVTKLRLGVLPLLIDKARCSPIRDPDTVRAMFQCPFCDSGDLESEHHFLFDCVFYARERHLFYTLLESDAAFTQAYGSLLPFLTPDVRLFICVGDSTPTSVYELFADYLWTIWTKRAACLADSDETLAVDGR